MTVAAARTDWESMTPVTGLGQRPESITRSQRPNITGTLGNYRQNWPSNDLKVRKTRNVVRYR